MLLAALFAGILVLKRVLFGTKKAANVLAWRLEERTDND